ncbi:MAG: hypothetical protein MUF80_07545 [Burkholderiales bacterium]|jgi:hypothetical protein|nr:hypothetical protein [Burkholderiales bacterium]
MSQADYARLRNISRQRVHALVREGRVAVDDDGLVDVEASDAMLDATLDRSKAQRNRQIASAAAQPGLGGSAPGQAVREPVANDAQPSLIGDADAVASGHQAGEGHRGHAAPQTGDVQSTNSAADYWEHKARRERIEADRAELALAKQRGELADVAEVRRLQREVYAKAATSIMQIPARIAPVCVALDAAAIEKLMHDEIERVLLSVAQNLEGGE